MTRSTLTAALSRLVPPGAGPGAIEAGADDYVARRIAGDQDLIAGLELLDRLALERHGARFAEIEPSCEDSILKVFEESPEGAAILRRLVFLALEGSFCHPARGGNRGGVGWSFAGLGTSESDPSRCRAS